MKLKYETITRNLHLFGNGRCNNCFSKLKFEQILHIIPAKPKLVKLQK